MQLNALMPKAFGSFLPFAQRQAAVISDVDGKML